MRYRKKPVIVEGFRLGDYDVPEWGKELIQTGVLELTHDSLGDVSGGFLQTREGKMHGYTGDYILKGVEGECWFINSRIFDKTYEEIKDA